MSKYHLTDSAPESVVPSKEAQGFLHRYLDQIQQKKQRDTGFRTKLEAMDRALRAWIEEVEECGDRLKLLNMPVNLAQLDTTHAQYVNTYLGGYPIFPVVATPDAQEVGEKVEAVLDEHSRKGHWGRWLSLFFRYQLKYNFGCLELSWEGTNNWNLLFETLAQSPEYQPTIEYINRLYAPDPYNTLWDNRLHPAEVSRHGEWAGYNRLVPRQEVLRKFKILEEENKLFNHMDALEQSDNWQRNYWWDHPVVSRYSTVHKNTGWEAWLTVPDGPSSTQGSGMYMDTRLYCRITPSEFGLGGQQTSQIWMFEWINHKILYHAEPLATYNNLLPMYFGQAQDDNMGDRTPSQVEYVAPIQEASSDLLNARIGDSKRSIADRLFYDQRAVNPRHIASKDPSARIPVDLSMYATGSKISDAVWAQPYTDNNAGTVINDLRTLMLMPEMITGNNSADEGRFRKGNRTLGEYTDIMQNSSERTNNRLISIDQQVFADLKDQLKFNLVTRIDSDITVLNPELRQEIRLTPEDLRNVVMQFMLADGVKPKSMLANTDMWVRIWETLIQTGLIAQYNAPQMFEYLASLGGVSDLRRFRLSAGGPAGAAPGTGSPDSRGPSSGPTGTEASQEGVPSDVEGAPPVRIVQ